MINSKKSKIISLILMTAMILSMMIPVSAASEGIKDYNEAAGDKKILMYPLYLDGEDGFNESEGADKLLDGKTGTKYGTGTLPYRCEWKYEKEYTVERIILRTGNDNKTYPRRMGDGWTLSGSNDGANWSVIYTGSEDDVVNENNTCYFVDLPDNKNAYQYYQLNAEDAASDQTDSAIQLSMILLCVNESVEVPDARPYITRPGVIAGYGVTVIEAPDFDSGVYNETNAADGSHSCRPDEDVQTEFCGENYVGRYDDNDKPLDGALIGNIGWTAAGEWVQYTVEVKRDGIYRIDAWVASDNDEPGSVEIYLNGDDNLVGSVESIKEGWQVYSKGTAGTAEMTTGTHVIKVLFPTGAVNFQALEIVRTGEIEVPTEPPTDPPETDAAEDNADDNTPAADSGSDKDKGDDEGIPVILWIVIGGSVLVIIVIIILIVTRKKK